MKIKELIERALTKEKLFHEVKVKECKDGNNTSRIVFEVVVEFNGLCKNEC